MNRMLQVQNPHTGRFEPVYVTGLPDPQPAEIKVQTLPRSSSNAHPLLIIGIIIGALFGLIACLPGRIRACVILAILIGIAWFCWSATRDQAQAYAGTRVPVPAHRSLDFAPRAELVRLPSK